MKSSIQPVAVYPGTANTLMIRSGGLGPPPSYYYELQNVTNDVVVVLKNGNSFMTQEQWAAWPADADDDAVQLDAISENLGLTRI